MDLNNLVIVSDLHCGCQFGLCPPDGIELDGGGSYTPSVLQKEVWKTWRMFWDKWIPDVTHGEPFALLVNGDMIDGVHHGSTTQISQNLADQSDLAYKVMKPIVDKVACDENGNKRFYMIRGTESHVGKSAQEEERLAQMLGAKPDQFGRHARDELYIRVGGALCHAMHHIGTTSSLQAETTAINAELIREITESARWGEESPLFVVRSHRHRYARIALPARLVRKKHVEAISFCTPAWQLKTPFAYRTAQARLSPAQLGGAVIRTGDADVYARHFTLTIPRSVATKIESL